MESFLAAALWTFWLLVFVFPVTLVLMIVAIAASRSRDGRELRALGMRARLITMTPGIFLLILWAWSASFGLEGGGPGHDNDLVLRQAASGWRNVGIHFVLAAQALVTVFVAFLLPAGRLAAWSRGALLLWISLMASQVAHYAVLGLPIPVL